MKRFISLLIIINIMLYGFVMPVYADYTRGYLTFSDISGDVTITGCSIYATGNITIPEKIGSGRVTSIGDNAFYGCSYITGVNIPNSVTSIGDWAFSNCTGLTSIDIPNSVTSIGYCAFEECTNLVSVNIPNSVISISDNAFDDCTGLTSIDIPRSVVSIGDWAFIGCKNLLSITVDSSNPNFSSIDDNLYTKNGEKLLHYAIGKKDKTFSIPNNVTSIGTCAFYDCTNLTIINIPNTVTYIGESAFNGCNNLTYINIPNSVTFIGACAFTCCCVLTSINIPNSVTSIEKFTFYSCTKLTDITISKNVTSIGEYAFAYCPSLKTLLFLGDVPKLSSQTFIGTENVVAYAVDYLTSWRTSDLGIDTVLLEGKDDQFSKTGYGNFEVDDDSYFVNLNSIDDINSAKHIVATYLDNRLTSVSYLPIEGMVTKYNKTDYLPIDSTSYNIEKHFLWDDNLNPLR